MRGRRVVAAIASAVVLAVLGVASTAHAHVVYAVTGGSHGDTVWRAVAWTNSDHTRVGIEDLACDGYLYAEVWVRYPGDSQWRWKADDPCGEGHGAAQLSSPITRGSIRVCVWRSFVPYGTFCGEAYVS
jgi:hypothetical protein